MSAIANAAPISQPFASLAGTTLPADKNKSGPTGGSIQSIVKDLADAVENAVHEIHEVNANAKVLALNARIEAARAGQHGAAFGVVASEMQSLSQTITEVANSMSETTNSTIDRLLNLLGNNVLGTRLSDIARTNIDLVDRNLYERTCDVRWWATDSSLTTALATHSSDTLKYASERMRVILGAYTVYFDLVLCDSSGNIVANGRPDRYPSVGKNIGTASWFSNAMTSRSGDEFSFQSAHSSPLVNDQPSLIYSCAVRDNGASDGTPMGVLGVVFNWNGLSDPILRNLAATSEESRGATCLFIDGAGKLLASSVPVEWKDFLSTSDLQKIFSSPKGYFTSMHRGKPCCIAHAQAPGFETYSTGWYSVIVQPT